jgi:hypothetical protein
MSTTQNILANTPVKFSLKLVEVLYNETIYTHITNTKYEGEIKNSGDRVRVRTAGKVTLKNYTKGMALVSDDLNPIAEDLVIDRQSYFKFIVDDVDKLQNDVDTMNEYAKAALPTMSELIDSEILEYGRRNVFGPNALGTNYNVGTVAVAATTGVVTGTSTVFTAAMVGGYFRATTHPAGRWYIVTAFASGTSITIRDLGNEGVYTGGVVNAGAGYVINAATHLALTQTNVYGWLVQLNTVLNKSLAPRKARRFLVVNGDMETIIRLSPQFIPAVDVAYEEVVREGFVGRLAGFDVYFSELVAGNNTTGYWFLAGDQEFMAFAAQIMKVSMLSSDQDPNSFMSTCKGLLVRGFKVFEGNRGRGAVLRATCNIA